MKTRVLFRMLATAVAIMTLFAFTPKSALAQQICGSYNSSLLGNNSQYQFLGDQWNSSYSYVNQCETITDSTQPPPNGPSMVYSGDAFNDTTDTPADYPDFLYGCFQTYCTNNTALPLAVSSFSQYSMTTGETVTEPSGDNNDMAYDIWFNTYAGTPAKSNTTGTELMIWVQHNGSAGAIGCCTPVDDISSSGTTWSVFTGINSGNGGAGQVITFINDNGKGAVSDKAYTINLADFFAEALKLNQIQSSWYLTAIEFGTEIWSGGPGLAINNFWVNINQGGTPAISSLSPTSGNAGSTVTISGSNFGTSGTVSFGSTTASTSNWSSTSITATVPSSLSAASYNVTVSNTAGTSNAESFTVTTPVSHTPTISSISPTTVAPGAALTITGTNFTSSDTVSFSGTTVQVSTSSTTSLTVTVPSSLANGNYTVTVTNSGGTSNGASLTVKSNSTSAVLTSPTNGSTLTGSTATFTWSAGTNVTAYKLILGTSAGGSDVYNSYTVTVLTKAVSAIPVTGATLYATLYSQIGGTWYSTTASYTEYKSTKTIAVLTSPAAGTTSISPTSNCYNFAWGSVSGATAYKLIVGTTAGGSTIYNSYTTTALSEKVCSLPTSGTIYVTLYTELSSVWYSNAYTFTIGTAPTLTISASPTTVTVAAGGSSASTTLTASGTSSSVTYAVTSTLPTGVTATVSGSSIAFSASTSASAGTTTVTIKGTSGSLTATTSISLVVTKAISGGCSAAYATSPQSSSAFGATLAITNNSTTASNSWTVTLTYANGQTVASGWNGVFTQSGSVVTVNSESYNGSIAAGATLSGIGFNGTWNGTTNSNPTITCSLK